MNSVMLLRIVILCIVSATWSTAGCRSGVSGPVAVPSDLVAGDRSILAGEWEYEDGGVVAIRLDPQGNGTYTFKDGRFETTQFDGRTWVGKWYQKENDRDGGFVITLSADSIEGNGTWWYDRIGTNTAPSEKGGTFHVSRKTSLSSLGDTPPPP